MKGQYKTKEGKTVNVSHFDEANKIAYADLGDGESRWCPESEYSTWLKEGETVTLEEAVSEYLQDTALEIVEEIKLPEEVIKAEVQETKEQKKQSSVSKKKK